MVQAELDDGLVLFEKNVVSVVGEDCIQRVLADLYGLLAPFWILDVERLVVCF